MLYYKHIINIIYIMDQNISKDWMGLPNKGPKRPGGPRGPRGTSAPQEEESIWSQFWKEIMIPIMSAVVIPLLVLLVTYLKKRCSRAGLLEDKAEESQNESKDLELVEASKPKGKRRKHAKSKESDDLSDLEESNDEQKNIEDQPKQSRRPPIRTQETLALDGAISSEATPRELEVVVHPEPKDSLTL